MLDFPPKTWFCLVFRIHKKHGSHPHLVAGVDEDLPSARDRLRHLVVHGVVVHGLQDLLVAPDADLLRVRAPRDARVGRAVQTVIVLRDTVSKLEIG